MSAPRLSAVVRASKSLRAGPSSPSTLRQASSRAASRQAASSSSTPAPAPPSPFHPWKNPLTSRWRPPHFSLRRQAQLANLAWRQGVLRDLPPAPKFDKLRKRIEVSLSLEAQEVGTGASSEASSEWPPKTRSGPRSAPNQSAEKRALELARKLAASRGPYAGRSERRIFKGTKAQRTASTKRAATVVKLKGMQKSIEEWRKGLREAKDKSRSSVPF